MAYTNESEASKDITPRDDAQAITPMDVKEDTSASLVQETYVSPFECLLPRPLEPVGVPSLYFFPVMAQNVMSTMMSNS